jgi:cell division protein FtsA
MAGVEIRTVYAGVAGSHIRCQPSDGVAAIAGGEVTRADVDRVLEGARAIPVDADRQILHVLPREFTVDNQDGIRDPVGDERRPPRREGEPDHRGDELRAERRPLRRALRPHRGRRRARAARQRRGRALSEDEKEIGVAVIDIGGGTTDCSSTSTAASPTRASSRSAATTSRRHRRGPPHADGRGRAAQAQHGCALGRMVSDDEEIEVPGVGGHAPRRTAAASCRTSSSRASRRSSRSPQAHRGHGPARAALGGRRAHGRRGAHGGHDRVRRGDPRHARAPRRTRSASAASPSSSQGPQYATGVGLVLYGATALGRRARTGASEPRSSPARRRRRARGP